METSSSAASEIEVLRAQNVEILRELARAQRENAWLRERLERYLRKMFGAKAETIDLAQMKLPFAVLVEMAAAEVEEEKPEGAGEAADDEEHTPTQKKRKPGAHGRKPLPKDLPRLRVEHHPEPSELTCGCCKGSLSAIGEEITEELDWQPATFTVTEHVRVRYGCKVCQENVVIAALPARPIEKGRPGAGLLASILVSKYADHLPLHRLESVFERSGVELSRQTMCDWVAGSVKWLSSIVEAQMRSVFESAVIHTDDTHVMCQENALGAGKRKSYLWVYVGDRDEVVYDFTLSRAGEGPRTFIGSWKGYLQVDGYQAYDQLFAGGDVIEVACWAHVRRKYFESLGHDPGRASLMLGLIQQLYKIEKEAKGLDAEARCAIRRERAAPILERIRAQIDDDEKVVLPESGMGIAVRYAKNAWPGLLRYVDDGRLDIDNNAAERAMRCIAIGRKNWLFAGSPAGGKRAAVIYSLVATCKLLGIEPFTYLRDVLERLPTHPRERIAELTPRLWKAARAAGSSS